MNFQAPPPNFQAQERSLQAQQAFPVIKFFAAVLTIFIVSEWPLVLNMDDFTSHFILK